MSLYLTSKPAMTVRAHKHKLFQSSFWETFSKHLCEEKGLCMVVLFYQ